MSARILVVDDILTNVKLLEAKLSAEYFDVYTATSGLEALDMIKETPPDIILLDVMMPGMDGFEVCRRIKNNPETQHISVVMVTALDQKSDRLEGLKAGADDFLTKPVNDIALLARVKSLVRLKMVVDELRVRASTGSQMGVPMNHITAAPKNLTGKILIVEDDQLLVDRFKKAMIEEAGHDVTFAIDPEESLYLATAEEYDLAIISLCLEDIDGLRLCSQFKSLEKTRNLPVLVIVDDSDPKRLVRALDLGASDYISHPVDENELLARTTSSLKRKWYADQLRNNLEKSMELAVKDSLTGLHNRRYLESNLATAFERAVKNNQPLSLLLLDIDYFKKVNDTHGHDIGDEVLVEFSKRIATSVRSKDIAARLGGEEFVVVLTDSDQETSMMIAERLRETIADREFDNLSSDEALKITTSIGLSSIERRDDNADDLLKRADMALYTAKKKGRNRVEKFDL